MAGPSRRRLVLWDVDNTLVRVGPIGRELYGEAFRQVTGGPLRFHVRMAGRLDPDIFRDTIEAHDLDAADHPFATFTEALSAAYGSRFAQLAAQGRALPGARDALEALAAIPWTVQTVVTGNVPAVAALKLAAFGLDRHVELDVGGYGPDAAVRAGLVRIARLRAGAKHRATFGAEETVLVGDTTNDVAAGRDGGAFVIAVATGVDSAADLLEAGADTVLPDLSDTATLVRLVWDERSRALDTQG